MDVKRLMARVCTLLIPTQASKAEQNQQIINRISIKMLSSTEGVNINQRCFVICPLINIAFLIDHLYIS